MRIDPIELIINHNTNNKKTFYFISGNEFTLMEKTKNVIFDFYNKEGGFNKKKIKNISQYKNEIGLFESRNIYLIDDIKNIDENWIHEVKSLKKEIKKDYKEFLKTYGEFPEIIERNLPKNARWIRDVTISNSTWGNRLMPVEKWFQNIYPVGAGIGPGMSLGIGASLATEEKVKSIAMCGDGGFMLNVSELWTAVEINSNIIFMVMNDKGYGVIKHIQDSLYGGRRNFADLQVPNFKELADTVKMKYLIVKSSSEFENILKKAFNLSGPVLLEIDINSIGELPRYFIPPPFTEK